MSTQLFRHAWGAVGDDGPWSDLGALCDAAAREGYAGVEFPLFVLDSDPAGAEAVLATIDRLGLAYLPMVMTFVEDMRDPDAHLGALRRQLERVCSLEITRVNAHTGADAFDDVATERFLRESVAIAADLGIELLHETHRSRPLYNPWRTARMVEAVEGLRLTADYSHWVCVAERLPFDAAAEFATCAPAVGHVHARVGHAQAPQVSDPRDPAWATELGAHEHWWDQIVEAAADRDEPLTITPEFGPPPYMPTVPHTGEPVADLTEIVSWMRDRLRARYG